MSKYYYNGVLLPEIPADVLAEYPYAWIGKHEKKGQYQLFLSKYQWWYDVNKDTIRCANDTNLMNTKVIWYTIDVSTADTATEWIFYSDTDKTFSLNSRPVFWSSHNIKKNSEDSTEIYFYGSEPVDSNEPEEPDVFYKVNGNRLTKIANAIREKTGKPYSMTLEQMPTEIASITAGGGEGEKPFDCHSVTFVYNDKSYVRSVADGDTCADPVERGLIPTPTKESTVQYNYTFYGWGASDGGAADANILKNITEDKTVYAIFTATLQMYTITWLDEDGTVLNTQTLAYGATPGYTPTITKDNYSFAGWSPAISKVTGNATYTATWEENGWRWNLADGVLTISGAGPMENYSSSTPAPWNGSASLIKKVVIEDGITKVGQYAFSGCSALTDIQFGNLVSTIDGNAFGNCTALTSVTIPGTVTYLGWGIFNGCSKLTDIVLEEGTETITGSSGALQNTGLKRLTVRAKCICWQMYANCKTLTSVTFGSAVQGITSYAFYGCSNISSVVFEDTTGWYVTTTEGATSGTTLSSTNLANTSTAATYLKSTYDDYYWYKK